MDNLMQNGTADWSLFAFWLQTVESILVLCRIDKLEVLLPRLCSLLVTVQDRFLHPYDSTQGDNVFFIKSE